MVATGMAGVEFRFESIRRLYWEEFCGGRQQEAKVLNVKVEKCTICCLAPVL